ncbi:MAG: hypothetical protein QNI99_17330 [Woeseiaceae bacterium]|nr:hypothetical protein [Woeseiaceae bacterium]
MPTSRDYLIPKGYSDEQLLALLRRLDGDFAFSRAERSQVPMHLMFLVGLPALAAYRYFTGSADFPPVDYDDWLTLSLILIGVSGSIFIRVRRLENLRFRDGMIYFIDKTGMVTRSVSLSEITQAIIMSREKIGRVRIRTADTKIDFVVPDELIVAIQRDADDPFDMSRF